MAGGGKLDQSIRDDMKKETPREAAVSVVICLSDDPEYLVLKRALHPDDPWSGHYAFPGGGYESHDRSMLDCAIRETQEECGLRLEFAQMVKALPVKMAGNYLGKPVSVYPFVFQIQEKPRLKLHPPEVAGYEWLSLSYLRDCKNHTSKNMSPRFPSRQFPCIMVKHGYVWGFTYELLMQILDTDCHLS